MFSPIVQDQAYHRFVDTRAFAGIANAADTLSNLAFLVVGVMGLFFLWSARRDRQRFAMPEEVSAYWWLFGAVTATTFGSAYYHLAPDDARLVWDRLPIALAFMALLSAVIAERMSPRAGIRLLVPLLAFGAFSVLYWAFSGDLRIYLLTQFGAILAVLALAVFYPSRYSHGGAIFAAIVIYGLAKAVEFWDRPVFEAAGGSMSGHTLKHLLAAGALYAILWSLQRRGPAISAAYRSPASPSR
jgi:hypothetical protein